MRWSATFEDARHLRRLTSSVSKILSSANLKIGEDELQISGMDESRIAMAAWTAPATFFQEYEYEPDEEEQLIVGLNVGRLEDVMRRGSSDDRVTLSIDEERSNRLRIKFFRGTLEERQFERTFSIPLPEKTEEISPEGLAFSVTMEFAPPDDLSAIISDAAVFADDLKIETQREDKILKFIAESGIGSEYEYTAHVDKEESIINYEIDGSVEKAASIYSLDFLEDFTRADRVSESVQLKYSEENPLRLSYNISGGSSLKYLLAPRVT